MNKLLQINQYKVKKDQDLQIKIQNIRMQLPQIKNQKLEQMLTSDKFELKGSYNNQSISLHLISLDNIEGKQKQNSQKGKRLFELIFQLKKQPQALQNLFDKTQQLFQYMKQSQNVKIKTQGNVAVLVLQGKHPTKKSQLVELYKFTLNQKVPLLPSEIRATTQKVQAQSYKQNNLKIRTQLNDLLSLCEREQFKLNNQLNLKFFVTELTKKIAWVCESLYQIDSYGYQSQIHRVIDKIEHLGNQIEFVHMKTADIINDNDRILKAITQYKQKNEQIINKNEQIKHALKQVTSQYEQKFKNLQKSLQNSEEMIEKLRQKLNPSMLMLQQKQGIKKLRMVQKIQQNIQQQITRQMIDKTAKFFKHFVVKGNNITKQDDFIFPTILIGSRPLREKNQFTVKIDKMGILKKIYPGVCVGIVDSKHKNKQSCGAGDNVIQYSCASKLFESNKYINNEGNGFEAGDYVKVKVDFQAAAISWLINGKLMCKYSSKNILNPMIDWRPYIFMRDKGDSVDWIIQQ